MGCVQGEPLSVQPLDAILRDVNGVSFLFNKKIHVFVFLAFSVPTGLLQVHAGKYGVFKMSAA